MSRKSISPTVQAEVLLESRRRCCICFGLNRDTAIKQVQIAHLDKDSSNSAKDNLAVLCINHHDQYDSRTSQSKNFTPHEVKQFRVELLIAIESAFGNKIQFGRAVVPSSSIIGHYLRNGDYDSAEIWVQELETGGYHISGEALWGTHKKHGPNLGGFDFIADLDSDGTLSYSADDSGRGEYLAKFTFAGDNLIISERNWVGMFGNNVMFSGEYTRVS